MVPHCQFAQLQSLVFGIPWRKDGKACTKLNNKEWKAMRALRTISCLVTVLVLMCSVQEVLAHRTYLLGDGPETSSELFSDDINVTFTYGMHHGSLTGCIDGQIELEFISLLFQNPIGSGEYEFLIGNYEILSGASKYKGMATVFSTAETGDAYFALFGDLGATGLGDELELTSIMDHQYSGHFTHHDIVDNIIQQFEADVPLTINSLEIKDVPIGGYYNGKLAFEGKFFDISLDNIDWSGLGLPDLDELEAFAGRYKWDKTQQPKDDEIYIVFPLGTVTGSLAGVFVEDDEVFIEHSGTASPIPVPASIWLLGSGIGIMASVACKISRKQRVK